MSIAIHPAALHAILTDAHIAIVEGRAEWAGTALHVLRRLTAPAGVIPQGLAQRLQDSAAPSALTLPVGPGPALPDAAEPPPAAAPASVPAPAPAPAQAAGGDQPQARARGTTRNTGRAGGVWTTERDELLHRLWIEGKTAAEALVALNALPAASPVASEQAVFARANLLHIKRPKEVAAALLKRAGRIGAERAAAMAAAGVTTLGAKPLVWTTERLALGKELWEAGESAADMLPRLNALPGTVEISGDHTIMTQAAKQKWQRPADFLARKRAGYAERMRTLALRRHGKTEETEAPEPDHVAGASEMVAAPTPEPEPAPPAPEDPPELTPEQQAEIADAAVLSKQEAVRQALHRALREHRGSPSVQALAAIGTRHTMPLREVMRLLGDVRRAAALDTDCGCAARVDVLARLSEAGHKRASYLCPRGDACCALQAAAIRDLPILEDKP